MRQLVCLELFNQYYWCSGGLHRGASREEVFRLYQLAGKMQVPIFSHVRSGRTMAVQQAISDAILTNARLHNVHINSLNQLEIGLAIEMVQTAKSKGSISPPRYIPIPLAPPGYRPPFLMKGGTKGWELAMMRSSG